MVPVGVFLAAAMLFSDPVVPAYPGARLEAAPTVRLGPHGVRVEESRLLVDEPVSVVKRRLVRQLGAGRILSDVRDGPREVVVIGPSVARPTYTVWREPRDTATHLFVMRRLAPTR